MNKKSVLLYVGALGVILTSALLLQKQASPNEFFLEARATKMKKETAEARGYQDYMNSLRVNEITKELNLADVYKAREQARQEGYKSKKTAALGNLEWNAGGPDNIGGRTRAFFADKTNPNKLYIGNVSGGIWTSNDKGNTWVQIVGNDSSEAMSIGAITQAANGDMYYGTGEGFSFRANVNYSEMPNVIGEGIYKSTNGGASFAQLPATNPSNGNIITDNWSFVNSLSAHPTDANVVFAAANRGLYRTTDGGATWSKPTGLTSINTRFLDVEMSRQGNVVVAATSNGIFISTDGGNSFGVNVNTTANGLPGTGAIGRTEMAIAPSDENIIYAVMSNNAGATQGCYKSTNKGVSWTAIGQGGSNTWNPFGNQGDYNIAFGVHPTNPDMVFLGGQLDLYRYTPSETWVPIAYANQSSIFGKYVHADMHGIHFNSGNPNEMYVVTDGGFFRTENCTLPEPFFQEKNKNYSTAQCYSVAANRLGQILFGTQDNGTNAMKNNFLNSPQSSVSQIGGDGMDCAMSDYQPKYLFGCIQEGLLRRSSDGGSNASSFKTFFDKNIDNDPTNSSAFGAPDEGSNWVAPLLLKEFSSEKSVFCAGFSDNVWFTQDALSTGSTRWFPLVTANNAGFSAIAMSDDGQVAYAGTSNGTVYRITGINMKDSVYKYDNVQTNLLIDGFSMRSQFVVTAIANLGRHITDLECDATGNTLIISLPNYGSSTYVYRSLNARSAATPNVVSMQGNLPQMPVYSMAYLAPNEYLAGTELGVWGTDNGGATWTELNNFGGNVSQWHPKVPTMEIVVKDTRESINGAPGYSGKIIYTGTHGRGTFYSTSYATAWSVGVDDKVTSSNSLSVYPNPVVDNTNIKLNTDFSGNAVIKIVNINGRVVRDQYARINAGSNSVEVDMKGLASGLYVVSLNMGGKISTAKIIKR